MNYGRNFATARFTHNSYFIIHHCIMAFLDRFRKKEEKKKLEKLAEKTTVKSLASKKSAKEKAIKKVPLTGEDKEKKAGKKAIKSKFKGGYGVLIKPLITEKISEAASLRKYAFMVSSDANKPTVKKSVEALYGVKVQNVRIINVIGKKVRYGRSFGKRKDWKKAIITLAPGEKIEIYEGV